MQGICTNFSRLRSKKLILAGLRISLYLLQHENRIRMLQEDDQIRYETIAALRLQKLLRKGGAGPSPLSNMVEVLLLLLRYLTSRGSALQVL